MPSMVFWREGTGASATGRLVLGSEADELSTLAPWCLERAPKRRLGDEFMQLGDKELRVVEVIGRILREVHNEALASPAASRRPRSASPTPPAGSGPGSRSSARPPRSRGSPIPTFIPEPVAAAVHFACERLASGEHVAVYDLGGGTFDTAVLERTEGLVRGRRASPAATRSSAARTSTTCSTATSASSSRGRPGRRCAAPTRARNASGPRPTASSCATPAAPRRGSHAGPDYEFYMPPPIDQEIDANGDEFERLIARRLRHTVAELERTILAAGLKPADLAAIYLAGGSSRIPLVGRLIQERLGILPEHLDDPKAVIALGAAGSSDGSPRGLRRRAPTLAGGRPDPAASGFGDPADRSPAAPDPNATEIDVPTPPKPTGSPAARAVKATGDRRDTGTRPIGRQRRSSGRRRRAPRPRPGAGCGAGPEKLGRPRRLRRLPRPARSRR